MSRKYLAMLRKRYDAEIAAIDAIQDRAAAESEGGRELTETELAEIKTRSESATKLVPQIEAAAEQEQRNAAVESAAGEILARSGERPVGGERAGASGEDDEDGKGEQTRSVKRTGSTQTQDRDPGHYTRSSGSFFADMVRAREGDTDAARRLDEHQRALSSGVAGAGLVAPRWLTEEYESIARQGRMLASAVRQIPLGDNPAPITLQRQTTGTDAVLAEQATENTHPSETDAFATTTDVVVPKPTSGIQVVSRQLIDMSSPAADALIYGDMIAVYNRKVEDKVTTVAAAAAGTAVATFATESAFVGTPPAQPASDAIIDAAFALWNARKLPATVVAMRVSRWGRFNKLRDSSGRKLYPTADAGPVNVDGVGSVEAAGNVEGLPVIPTDGLGIGGVTYPESILVLRASDVILFEGDLMRFRFEEVAGPESIKLGVWAYTAAVVRQAASSVRRVVITAA